MKVEFQQANFRINRQAAQNSITSVVDINHYYELSVAHIQLKFT